MGENGAGKSTLGKVIAGVHRADDGELLVRGRPTRYRTPREALADGTTIIAQELSLVPKLSVFRNVFLGVEQSRAGLVSDRALRRRFDELNARTGFGLPADVRTGRLGIADQQKVELLRALARDASLIVMDEPTASLTTDESQKLFDIVRRLRQEGVTVIYVSHFLEEVLALVDEVTVLKDGRLVRTSPVAEESPVRLVEAMLGRQLESTRPARTVVEADAPGGAVGARPLPGRRARGHLVRGARRRGRRPGGAHRLRPHASWRARSSAPTAPTPAPSSSTGQAASIRKPRDAVKAGIAMLPESRKDQGLLMRRPIVENVSLPHLRSMSAGGVVARRREGREVGAMTKQVDVRGGGGLSARVTVALGRQPAEGAVRQVAVPAAAAADPGRAHARGRRGRQARASTS